MDRSLGRYDLIRRLGRGGMGEVWEAVLRGPHGFTRRVALKILRGQGAADDTGGLIGEARLGALLHHPNVVGVHELGRDEQTGRWFMAMELVDGLSAQALVRSVRLSGRDVVDIGIQSAAGLAHIHGLEVDGRGAGVVHRDIKPGNLLVDRHGQVKIADLGVARLVEALSGVAAEVAGTPAYMAPEQRRGEEDARADLFSLGATLYALLTGRSPLGKGKAALQRAAQIDALVADPAFLRPVEQAAPGLGPVLARCLCRDPSERFGTARQLQRALSEVLHRQDTALPLAMRVAMARGDLATSLDAPPDAPTEPSNRTASPSAGSTVLPDDLPAVELSGRERELGVLLDLLRGQGGVVTIVGPGGVGKTTLAVEAARRRGLQRSREPRFVDLTEVHTVDRFVAAVADALGVRRTAEREAADLVDVLADALRLRPGELVVLDNVEQIAEAVAPVIARWVAAAPEVWLVVTTQRTLDLRDEAVLRLGPMTRREGVALFRRRAARAVPEDDAALGALIDRLDAIPLAIELAAARASIMSVPRLTARLDERLALLAGGGTDRPARHRSLAASLAATWDLLEEHERSALAQLSVFAGGFDLDAAEAVVRLQDGGPWMFDVLQSLVRHSLLRFEPSEDRFRLLLSVQAFAAEQLRDRTEAERRHGQWYAQLGSVEALRALRRRGGFERARTGAREADNLRAAARRAVARGDGAIAAAAAVALRQLQTGPPDAEGIALLHQALELGSDHTDLPHTLAGALVGAGRADDAWRVVAEAEERLSDPAEVAWLDYVRGVIHESRGQFAQARACVERALEVVSSGDRPEREGLALLFLGDLHGVDGAPVAALEAMDRALAIAEQRGDLGLEMRVLASRGMTRARLGRHQGGAGDLERATELARRLGDVHREQQYVADQSNVAPDLPAAAARVRHAMELAHREGIRWRLAIRHLQLAQCEVRLGRVDQAVRAAETARRLDCESPYEMDAALSCRVLTECYEVAGRLDEALDLALEGVRHAESLESALEPPLAWVMLARVRLARDELGEAAVALERATEGTRHVSARRIGHLLDLTGAELALRRGDAAGASQRATRAAVALEGSESSLAAAFGWGVVGAAALVQGDRAAAEEAAARGARLIEQRGARSGVEVERVRRLERALAGTGPADGAR